jgi:hypothetical protein
MAVFIDMSNVNLHRSMVFGGDETVGGSTVVRTNQRKLPFSRDVKVNDFSLILYIS